MRTQGKLLGRATSLWVGLVAGVLDLAVVVFHVPLDVTQVVTINGFAFILLGFLANEENPTTAGTLSGTTEAPSITITKHSA